MCHILASRYCLKKQIIVIIRNKTVRETWYPLKFTPIKKAPGNPALFCILSSKLSFDFPFARAIIIEGLCHRLFSFFPHHSCECGRNGSFFFIFGR